MSWGFGELVAFDVETTGVDVETTRIVTAAVGHVVDGEVLTMTIAEAFRRLGRMSCDELHAMQQKWHREQAESLAAFFRQKANEEEARAAHLDDAQRQVVLQDVAQLRDRADGVVTEWPMSRQP